LLVPVIFVAAAWLGSLILIWFYRPYVGATFVRPDWRQAFGMLKETLPLGGAMLLVQMLYYIDTVMMGMLQMEAATGLYNAGFKIVVFLTTCGAFYYDAIFPVMCSYYEKSREALQRLLSQTARLMLSVGLPLATGGALLAQPLLNMFYGPAYDPAAAVFRILIWFAALMYLNMIYDRGLWACGRYKTYLAIIAAEVCLNVVLNALLLPRFGIIGAAGCKLGVTLLGFGFYYRVFNGIVSVPFVRFLLRPALACLVMAAALWGGLLLHWPVLLLIGLGGVVYLAVLWGLRGITAEDLRFVRSLLIKR
jgi:O-antigen/teichoic acid export membrane protein